MWKFSGISTHRFDGLHQRIGSSSAYQGKIARSYALERVSGYRFPPTANKPSGWLSASVTDGNTGLLSSSKVSLIDSMAKQP